ncbi:transposase [Streptomyces sp. NPDC056831]|uniref:transposase n=1 Tax=Streptomyces sp. NPDC056831 TaxID=3345954 RepID=UPI003690A778
MACARRWHSARSCRQSDLPVVDHDVVIRRHELSDSEWELLRPLLPWPTLGPPAGDRTVLNGMVWKFRTCTAWRDVPERYRSWATLHTRFRRWARTARSTGCSRPPRQRPMRSATPTGLCRSTPAMSAQ